MTQRLLLNIGCGKHLIDGYVNADKHPQDGAEYADVMELPYEDETFEEVRCYNLLEHVKDPFKAVHEIHRVLEAGGEVQGSVPFLHPYHGHEDYWRFTPQGVRLLFKDFSYIRVWRAAGNFAVVGMFSGKARFIFDFLDRLWRVGNHSATALFFKAQKGDRHD